MFENLEDSNNDVGDRLKYLRKMYRFTRKYFREKYNIPEITLQKWETSERKISEYAIIKILDIYKKENVLVTKEWLLNGTGDKPKTVFPENNVDYNNISIDFSESDEILTNKEIEFFEKNHKNAKIIIVEDDDMEPIYKFGDYVGGEEISKSDFEKLDNVDCILLIKNDNSYILRRINKDNKGNFRISILNRDSKNVKPVIYNAKFEFVAPVIWIRRQNRFKQK